MMMVLALVVLVAASNQRCQLLALAVLCFRVLWGAVVNLFGGTGGVGGRP